MRHNLRSTLQAVILGGAMALGLSACSTAHIDDYAGTQPSLSLRNDFNGTVHAWGHTQDRSGNTLSFRKDMP